MISMSMTGMAETLANLEKTQVLLPEEIDAVLDDVGQQTVAICQDTSPVRSGEMRDGFAYQMTHMSVTVYNPVLHSLFVELGTYKMAAQPTLFPAFTQMCAECLNELRSL